MSENHSCTIVILAVKATPKLIVQLCSILRAHKSVAFLRLQNRRPESDTELVIETFEPLYCTISINCIKIGQSRVTTTSVLLRRKIGACHVIGFGVKVIQRNAKT